ncbi:MAG: DUF1731 domain-containing protein [Mycobacteriaceae bacterium]|nr:DUF1731 domain-containing protein [Mycobacteriaceae bacterium]
MGISYASVVEHPLEDVFAWHTRAGAMPRLVPPWQPMRVVKETESLANGCAILGLPGGLRWIARHEPAGYDPPHQFLDVLSSAGVMSLPPRVIGWWRHTHRFSAVGPGATRVHDEVDTTVPGAALRSTFAYRHRQLAEDLAAHRDAANAGAGSLTVAVTGSSGLVGTALCAFLSTGGHRVVRLVRGEPRGDDERRWNPQEPAVPAVVADWEQATAPAAEAGLRVVTVRTGIVQAAAGGTLKLLRPLFAAGLGGRLGSGLQWLSWISIDDLLDVYYRALYDTRLSGPVNAVAPHPVRNAEYTRALAATLRRPALLPVPSIGPRMLLGKQGAAELAQANQRVQPAKLEALAHRFRQSTIEDALAHQLGKDPAPGVL